MSPLTAVILVIAVAIVTDIMTIASLILLCAIGLVALCSWEDAAAPALQRKLLGSGAA